MNLKISKLYSIYYVISISLCFIWILFEYYLVPNMGWVLYNVIIIIICSIVYDLIIKYCILYNYYNISLSSFIEKYRDITSGKRVFGSGIVILFYSIIFLTIYIVARLIGEKIFGVFNIGDIIFDSCYVLLLPIFIAHFKSFYYINKKNEIIVIKPFELITYDVNDQTNFDDGGILGQSYVEVSGNQIIKLPFQLKIKKDTLNL